MRARIAVLCARADSHAQLDMRAQQLHAFVCPFYAAAATYTVAATGARAEPRPSINVSIIDLFSFSYFR